MTPSKFSISNFLIGCFLGLLAGAVLGVVLDKFLETGIFSYPLLKEAFRLEFYIIKIEIQLTPASLFGLVATGYLVLKKG